MKITFLGTGAAEGIPAVWCECELCKQVKMLGGKDIRRRCTYAVDDDTMIDFGPDAVRQTQDAGIDLTRLERIIFTHNHPDHLSPMELQFRRTGYFSRVSRELTVIGSCRIFSRILSFTAEDCGIYTLADLRIRPLEIRAGRNRHGPGACRHRARRDACARQGGAAVRSLSAAENVFSSPTTPASLRFRARAAARRPAGPGRRRLHDGEFRKTGGRSFRHEGRSGVSGQAPCPRLPRRRIAGLCEPFFPQRPLSAQGSGSILSAACDQGCL